MTWKPSYLKLFSTGELADRIATARTIMHDCTLCPRRCHVNRVKGERGYCMIGSQPHVASWGPHFGEEPPLSGHLGSGTIFLGGCNLRCIYCQNFSISQGGEGAGVTAIELSRMMISLWRRGCHNINFVTPTHQVAQILESLPLAIAQGLDVPLVYNCGGYEELTTLQLLDGIFDIYLPDFKYGGNDIALQLSDVSDYVETAKTAIIEMHRQVGVLQLDAKGVARQGLLIRHLVLPGGVADTAKIMGFIARKLSRHTYVNLMDQYYPCSLANEHTIINRRITRAEFAEALAAACEEGLQRVGGDFP